MTKRALDKEYAGRKREIEAHETRGSWRMESRLGVGRELVIGRCDKGSPVRPVCNDCGEVYEGAYRRQLLSLFDYAQVPTRVNFFCL